MRQLLGELLSSVQVQSSPVEEEDRGCEAGGMS